MVMVVVVKLAVFVHHIAIAPFGAVKILFTILALLDVAGFA
jgi:hypothetical protein